MRPETCCTVPKTAFTEYGVNAASISCPSRMICTSEALACGARGAPAEFCDTRGLSEDEVEQSS